MSANNKKMIIERRKNLRLALDRLIILISMPDKDIGHIKLQFTKNLVNDLDSIVRHVSYGDRYIHEPYIYVNGHDQPPDTNPENQITK
jgi:hypothetical protein